MRTTLVLGVAGALALSWAPAARAADERPAIIARALARSPVYVSDSLERVAKPAEVRALRSAVRRLPFRAYVVIVPVFRGETGLASGDDLLAVLHDLLGRDGIYLVSDESGIFQTAASYGAAVRYPADRVTLAALEDVPRREGPVARARYALELMRTGRRTPDEQGGIPNGLLTALAGLAVFTPLTARWWRRRPRPAPRLRASEAPADVERQARDALAALAGRLESAHSAPDAAFRLYDAASKAVGEARHPVDWVGALVLAREGAMAVEGRLSPPPCFFNPLHGDGDDRTRWSLGGRTAEIPACRSCARSVRRGIAPASLLDRGRPYWERDTLWARTGFGALDEDLTDRVLAGAAWR
jgi:hypothetical protein